MADLESLKANVDRALGEGNPSEALCYLAEIVSAHPDDRHSRVALAIALGDAGNPAGALRVLRSTADHLAHKGWLLPAMVVVRHGLQHAANDPSLIATLKRLHVRGVRARAGNLPVPPPLKRKDPERGEVTAQKLLELNESQRLEQAEQIGAKFPNSGEAAIPLPMPLFCELDEEAFVETVKRLRYKRVPAGTKLLVEGEQGNTLLVIASGHVDIQISGKNLAKLGPGSVLGEMALITGAPRSASAVAHEEVEYFELSREDVQQLANSKPKIAEELVEYCRKRLIANLLRSSPLFERFDDATRYALIERFQRQGYQPGSTLIEQGKPGEGLFVIATGEVDVSVSDDGGAPVSVATLGPGEVVGEISLLKDQATNATVTAKGRVGALFLPRDEFRNVLDENTEVRQYLEGLSEDRIKAREALQHRDGVDADDLIVL